MENVVLGGLALLPGRKEQPQNWEVEPVHFFIFREVGIALVAGPVLDTGQYHGDLCGAQDICWQLTLL